MFAEILLADGTKFFSSEGMLVSFYIYASFFFRIAPNDMLTAIAKTVTICDTKEYNEYVGEHSTKYSFLKDNTW